MPLPHVRVRVRRATPDDVPGTDARPDALEPASMRC
jgi:hypothetical protein